MATKPVTEDKYVYQPLPIDPTGQQMSLRFVVLKPGLETGEIQCSIFHHTFTERPQWGKGPVQYEALSYMWGPPTPLRHIILEGKRFPIRENLYWALIHLRLKDEERQIWIDGICINQDDNDEKDIQVAQMRYLYQGATKVTVWLGLENLGLETNAIDVLKRISERTKGIEFKFTREWWKKLYDELKDTGDSKVPEWVAIKRFCELEYWTRIWIVQEVVLGYRVNIQWGRGAMTWHDLNEVLDRVSEIEEDSEFGIPIRPWTEILTASLTFRLCKQKFGGGKARAYDIHTAYEALGIYEESGCFDIRDKVFGMVGISRSKIPVNYASSILELCGEIIKDAVIQAEFRAVSQNLFVAGEYIHKILCSPDTTLSAAFKSGQRLSPLPAPIEVVGNISGQIVHLTDTLDKYQSHSQLSLQLELMGLSSVIQDIPELQRQLAYLSILIKEIPDQISQQFGDQNLNRAWAIPETTSYGQETNTWSEFHIWKTDEVVQRALDENEKSSMKAFSDGTFSTPEETIASLILIACAKLPPESLKEIKLFFASSGLIGFASQNVVVGDMICTLMKSQTLSIVRQSQEEAKLDPVGIASTYSRDLDKLAVGPLKPVRGGMMDMGMIPDRMIRFYLDLGTFQALCCFNRQAAEFVGSQKNRSKEVRRRLHPYAYVSR